MKFKCKSCEYKCVLEVKELETTVPLFCACYSELIRDPKWRKIK